MTEPLYIKSILLVEDSEDDYEAILRASQKVGLKYPIIWCRTGQQALAYLEEGKSGALPVLIFLDLNMPGLDGRKILQHIKQDAGLQHIPVIILTTSASERDVKACYQAGANSYIQKPLDYEGLTQTIRCIGDYWLETALLPI